MEGAGTTSTTNSTSRIAFMHCMKDKFNPSASGPASESVSNSDESESESETSGGQDVWRVRLLRRGGCLRPRFLKVGLPDAGVAGSKLWPDSAVKSAPVAGMEFRGFPVLFDGMKRMLVFLLLFFFRRRRSEDVRPKTREAIQCKAYVNGTLNA